MQNCPFDPILCFLFVIELALIVSSWSVSFQLKQEIRRAVQYGKPAAACGKYKVAVSYDIEKRLAPNLGGGGGEDGGERARYLFSLGRSGNVLWIGPLVAYFRTGFGLWNSQGGQIIK